MLITQSDATEASSLALSAESARDHRWAQRNNCRIAAEISHHTLAEAVSCVIRDTSSSGARIELTSVRGAFAAGTERIPDHITVVMTIDRMAVECRVAWRRGTMIGVRYLSPARSLPKKPAAARFATAKKQDNSLLGKLFKR